MEQTVQEECMNQTTGERILAISVGPLSREMYACLFISKLLQFPILYINNRDTYDDCYSRHKL